MNMVSTILASLLFMLNTSTSVLANTSEANNTTRLIVNGLKLKLYSYSGPKENTTISIYRGKTFNIDCKDGNPRLHAKLKLHDDVIYRYLEIKHKKKARQWDGSERKKGSIKVIVSNKEHKLVNAKYARDIFWAKDDTEGSVEIVIAIIARKKSNPSDNMDAYQLGISRKETWNNIIQACD